MEKFIEVYDDIIPKHLQDFYENIVIKDCRINFYYKENIAQKSQIPSPGFVHQFTYYKDQPTSKRFSFYPILYKMADSLNIIVETILLGRVFLHTPSPNPGPDIKHIDIEDIKHMVCLYYINDSDGDTILFNDNGEEIKRVSPKKGRIVFFDGSIPHCSSRPSKSSRAIVNFDFVPFNPNQFG